MIAKEVMQKKFVSAEKSETVSSLIGKFKDTKNNTGFVFENNQFLGIINLKTLLRTRILRNEKLEKLIWHVPCIPEEEDIIDVATLMFQSNSSALPVVVNDKVVGAVFATDIIKQMKFIPEVKELRVIDIRHPSLKFVSENDGLGKAIDIMIDGDFNRLPILDERKKIIGMVSFGDIMTKFLPWYMNRDGGFKSSLEHQSSKGFKGEKIDFLGMPVSNFKGTKEIITASLNDKITKLVDLMVSNDISGIVIIDKNKADSIVTKRDLLEVIMNTKKVVVKNIQFVGLSELEDDNPHLKDFVEKISSYYAEKISLALKDVEAIKVHIKTHQKGGKAHKYSVHVKIMSPNVSITSTKAVDWDISRVMHKAFKDVENQIVHKSKAYMGYKKTRR